MNVGRKTPPWSMPHGSHTIYDHFSKIYRRLTLDKMTKTQVT